MVDTELTQKVDDTETSDSPTVDEGPASPTTSETADAAAIVPTVIICEDCVALTAWLTSKPPAGDVHQIHKDGTSWLETIRTCQGCVRLGYFLPLECENVTRCDVTIQRDVHDKIAARSLEFRRDPELWLTHEIPIWAEEDSLTATDRDISTLACADVENVTDSVSLINQWLNRCVIGGLEYGPEKDRHDLCRWSMTRTIVEEDTETIPADRIIHVGDESSNTIRLIETAGLRAKYCALSHCWGPIDKRPPCTTTENEKSHFEGIDIGTLPKTFREALELTRGLGVQYLWIDSLCIRQDDKEHWQLESAQMGAIYEKAYLRIAATGATNCGEGLFGERIGPPLKTIFQSDVDADSEELIHHIIYLQAIGRMDFEPNESLLTTRAWCFQEARLSRRTVSFMRPGICWDCRDIDYNGLDERDSYRFFPRVNWTNWESNIEAYSRTQLTFESDRLFALEGLANEYCKRWKDAHYFGVPHYFGVLRDGLPRQLLWRTDRPQFGMRGLADLPSWTWAAWPGEKQFLYKRFPIPDDNAGVIVRFRQLEGDGRTLTLAGCLVPCSVSQRTVEIGSIGFEVTADNVKAWAIDDDKYSYMTLYSRYSPEFHLTHPSQTRTPARLLWTEIEGVKQLVGMAQLDGEMQSSNLFFSCCLMARRLRNDPLRILFEASDSGLNEEQADELPDWTIIKEHGKGKLFYFIVLLEATDQQNTFRRAGSGIVWPTTWIQDKPEDQTFHLI